MKESLMAALLALALLFGIPWLTAKEVSAEDGTTPAPTEQTDSTDTVQGEKDSAIRLKVWNGTEVQEMTMADYLPGVVRGEMPASFEEEALKAQAVAERSYILYQVAHGPKENHPTADVCMDPKCCNAYVSAEKAAQNWGDAAADNEAKIQKAVRETDGYVTLYDNQPILAVFHSSSAGKTESSGDVWSSNLPYLVGVTSPENADTVPNYYSTATFAAADFKAAFLAAYPAADLSGAPDTWCKDLIKNGSDRVEKITVGGVTVTGVELRTVLKLRSASFTVEAAGDTLTFHVTGYGHGVGMSQYGANELAREGKTWQEILAWYYAGVTFAPYQPRA